MRNAFSVGFTPLRESLDIFKKCLSRCHRLDYQPLFEIGALAPPSEHNIEPTVAASVYNEGVSHERKRNGRLLCSKNFLSCSKVFISTHFNEILVWFISLDMAAERNALMERIYPRLKEFAQEKGYEFQVGLIKGTTYYPAKDMIFLVFWTMARYLGQSY